MPKFVQSLCTNFGMMPAFKCDEKFSLINSLGPLNSTTLLYNNCCKPIIKTY